MMTYSYTQISRYLTCPRSYRHRYLDGWREKDTRANMLFGRVFEKALAALFLRQDPGAVLFREWSAHQNSPLNYSRNDSWDQRLRQGIQLLERLFRTTVFACASPAATCRSSLRDQSPARMTS